ncbi:MAG: AraC family transcriptional regulator [Paludibacteraceae bacterium]|nr:AraC family transcriptional regulator [Paludibacteraceae bacterium]
MLTPYSFFVSVLHTLPFSNSILIALFIFFFADWRKDHTSRALLMFFVAHVLTFLVWLWYEIIIVDPPLPILDFFMMFYAMLLTPFFYNYVYAVTTGHCMRWKRWVAFYLPLVLLFVAHRVVYNYFGSAPFADSLGEITLYWSHPDMIMRFITFLVRISYGLIIVVGTYVNYKRYQSDLEKDFSTVSSRSTFGWMYFTTSLYIIYFLLSIVSYVDSSMSMHLFVFLSSVILNVALAFFGFAHKGVYSPDFEPLSQLEPVLTTSESQVPYQKMEQRFKFLCNSEQIWRNSELAATDVIAHLNTNRTYFSKFLQDVYKTNFRTCVNEYRIAEAQKMMRENPDITIADLYTQCGFSSSSSFNEWFKKITGKTPSEYKEQF